MTPAAERFDLDRLPARAAYAALAAVGTLVSVAGSLLYGEAPPIPYGFLPDLRPVLVLGIVGGLGLAGAFFQGARTALLWTVTLLVVVFELDHATVHWFSSFEGTLAGGRLDPLRLAGAALALAGALLLQADAHAVDAARDFRARGVPAEEAGGAAVALGALARRRVAGVTAGGLAAGAIVLVADVPFGGATLGPGEAGLAAGLAVLALGAAMLAGAGVGRRGRA